MKKFEQPMRTGINDIAIPILYVYRPILRLLLALIDGVFKIDSKLPWIREKFPWTDRKKSSMSYLPINENIKTESEVVPKDILIEIIESASHHVIMSKCACRTGKQCENHTEDIGCMFMGESALDMPSTLLRRVTKEEAVAHALKAIDDKLIPMIGKVRFDNDAYLIRDREQLLSLCFCCSCCCMMRGFRYLPAEHMDNLMTPLEGVKVEVSEDCIGCGVCEEHCGFDAISIHDGASIHGDKCRQCGRCVHYCPNDAMTVSIENPNLKDALVGRLKSYVDWES